MLRLASVPALLDVQDVLLDRLPAYPDAWEWLATTDLDEVVQWAECEIDADRSRWRTYGCALDAPAGPSRLIPRP
jgi:hypothetical protein